MHNKHTLVATFKPIRGLTCYSLLPDIVLWCEHAIPACFQTTRGLHKGLHQLEGCGMCISCVTGVAVTSFPPLHSLSVPPLCVFCHWKFDHRQISWHCSLTEHLYVFVCMGGGGGGGGRGKREIERVLSSP